MIKSPLEIPPIKQPMRNGKIGIRESYVKTALKQGRMMKVSTLKESAIVDPREWLKGAQIIEKEYNYPGNPLRFVCNYLPKEEVENPQISLF